MKKDQPTFIDLFSGCGGLSLGLMNAGWKGIFAIEQCPDAFKTLRYNLIDENSHNIGRGKFSWPDWLEIAPHEISEFLKTYRNELEKSCENIDLVAGGPPCQGFSFAGRRLVDDPRNELFKHHLKVVDILKPNLVLMENVQGINSDFEEKNDTEYPENKNGKKNYAKIIFETLEDHGYHVQQHVIRAMDFGVPQYRPRYFTLGIRKDLEQSIKYFDIKEELSFERKSFLERKGLSPYKPVTVSEAISDLTTNEKIIIVIVHAL